jgi:hypothetical protein
MRPGLAGSRIGVSAGVGFLDDACPPKLQRRRIADLVPRVRVSRGPRTSSDDGLGGPALDGVLGEPVQDVVLEGLGEALVLVIAPGEVAERVPAIRKVRDLVARPRRDEANRSDRVPTSEDYLIQQAAGRKTGLGITPNQNGGLRWAS